MKIHPGVIRRSSRRFAVAASWRLALLLAVSAGVLLGAACSGGGGDSETPAADVSPTSQVSPERMLLDQAVLHLEDLPEGLIRVIASESTNEQLAEDAADPEAELKRLEDLGRLLALAVNFVADAEAPEDLHIVAIESTASVYVAPQGARASYEEDAESARSTDWLQAYPNLTDVQIDEIDRQDLADEVTWIRITGFLTEEGTTSLQIEDFVVFLRDRIRGFIRAFSLIEAGTDRDALRQDIAGFTARQVERIDSALLSEG